MSEPTTVQGKVDAAKQKALVDSKGHSVERSNLYAAGANNGLFIYPAASIAADDAGTKMKDLPLGSRSRCYCDSNIALHHKYKVAELTWKCIHLLTREGRSFIQNLTPDVDSSDPQVKARNFDKLLMAGHSREDLVALTDAELHYAVKEMMGIS